jgi:hypothetical protein
MVQSSVERRNALLLLAGYFIQEAKVRHTGGFRVFQKTSFQNTIF